VEVFYGKTHGTGASQSGRNIVAGPNGPSTPRNLRNGQNKSVCTLRHCKEFGATEDRTTNGSHAAGGGRHQPPALSTRPESVKAEIKKVCSGSKRPGTIGGRISLSRRWSKGSSRIKKRVRPRLLESDSHRFCWGRRRGITYSRSERALIGGKGSYRGKQTLGKERQRLVQKGSKQQPFWHLPRAQGTKRGVALFMLRAFLKLGGGSF